MSGAGHPGRSTLVVGLLLALLLAVAYAITSWSAAGPEPTTAPATPAPVPPVPPVASQTPSPDTPTRGAGYPVRKVGSLERDRSVLVNGLGNADLRYERAPHNGTRLHFICRGCDDDTWLVEQPRGNAVGGGPLADPADVTWALDTVQPGGTTDLLVRAPAGAGWTVTLTPFDAVPVHEQTFDALGDDVVAVRARTDLQVRCGGAAIVSTLARETGATDYAVVQLRQEDDPGTWPVTAPTGSDLMILMVSCPGRWTVTVP